MKNWIPAIATQIRWYYSAAFVFLAFGSIAWIISELALLGISMPPLFTYGKLRPIYQNLFLFGFFYSIFKATCLYTMYTNDHPETWQINLSSFFSWLLMIGLLPLGTLALFFGFSSGRDYGEFPYLIDVFWLIGHISFCCSFFLFYRKNKKDYLTNILLGILMLQLIYYLIGNLAMPHSLNLLAATPLYTGYADFSSGEIYRNGIQLFYMVVPIVVILGKYLPIYIKQDKFNKIIQTNQEVNIFSEKKFQCFVILTIILGPLAQIGLLYTPVSMTIQTTNVLGYLLLQCAILMGIVFIRQLLNQEGKIFSSEGLTILLRFGLFILLIKTSLRLLLAIPILARYFAYSNLSITNLGSDISSYGMILFLSLAIMIYHLFAKRNISRGWISFIVIIMISVTILAAFANSLEAILQIVQTNSKNSDGTLVVTKWQDIYFAGSLSIEDSKNAILRTLMGLKGFTIILTQIFAISLFLFSCQFIWKLYGKGKNLQKLGAK